MFLCWKKNPDPDLHFYFFSVNKCKKTQANQQPSYALILKVWLFENVEYGSS